MMLAAGMVCKQPYSLTDTKSYSAGTGPEILCILCTFSLFHTELNQRNILNVLQRARFADAHWELLGQELMIEQHYLLTIGANRFHQANFCIIDTISQWLNNDIAASWEKLAAAVAEVKGYGKANADIVRQEAGLGKTDFFL